MGRAAVVLATVSAVALAFAAWAEDRSEFNRPGNVLIADQFNNRVIEVRPDGRIIWQYGAGPNDVSGASPIAVNDALRVGTLTLVSGTGAPPGTEPNCPNGCADNRVMFVDRHGRIVWQYGTFGVTGAGPNQLNTPVQATFTAHRTVLIADQGNQRVIEVDLHKHLIWQYGQTGVAGSGPGQLNNPNSVELLANGDLLIADEGNNRAIEITRAGALVSTFSIGGAAGAIAFASRLPSGATLLTDSGANRIVEVNGQDQLVWSYATNAQAGGNPAPQPTRAVRLLDGDTLISDQFNHRVIRVDGAKHLVTQYGQLNVAGFGAASTQQGLNGPYDAKVIGDNTGLTLFHADGEGDVVGGAHGEDRGGRD